MADDKLKLIKEVVNLHSKDLRILNNEIKKLREENKILWKALSKKQDQTDLNKSSSFNDLFNDFFGKK